MIFKLCSREDWARAEAFGRYEGSAVDVADGFIHFSDADTVAETAAKHFASQSGLVLVAVDEHRLGEALRWEVSRGGKLFPHLYAPLPLTAAVWVRPLPLGPDGRHVFPADLR